MKTILSEMLVLVSINVSTFSGYRKATKEIIEKLGGKLPDSSTYTKGSFKIFPNDGTKAFATIKRRLYRQLQVLGLRALESKNVFAIHKDDLIKAEKIISDAQQDFDQEKLGLDASYESKFEQHVANHPEASSILRALKVDRTTVVSKCRFSSAIFQISSVPATGQTEEEGVATMVDMLGKQLFGEITSEMIDVYKSEQFLRKRPGQKALRPLREVAAKAEKLSFLNENLLAIPLLVYEILNTLPTTGYIEGQHFLFLDKLVETMSDQDMLLNACGLKLKGIPACDILFPRQASQSQAVQPRTHQVIKPPSSQQPLLGIPSLPVPRGPVSPTSQPLTSIPLAKKTGVNGNHLFF